MCNSHTLSHTCQVANYHGRLDLLGPIRSPTKATLGSNTCQLFFPLATSTFHEAHILSHEHCPQSCLWHTKILLGYFFIGWLRLKMEPYVMLLMHACNIGPLSNHLGVGTTRRKLVHYNRPLRLVARKCMNKPFWLPTKGFRWSMSKNDNQKLSVDN